MELIAREVLSGTTLVEVEARLLASAPTIQRRYHSKGVRIEGKLAPAAVGDVARKLGAEAPEIEVYKVDGVAGRIAPAFLAVQSSGGRSLTFSLEWSGRTFGKGRVAMYDRPGEPWRVHIDGWDGEKLVSHVTSHGVQSSLFRMPVVPAGIGQWKRNWEEEPSVIARDLEAMVAVLLESTKVRCGCSVMADGPMAELWEKLEAGGFGKTRALVQVSFMARFETLAALMHCIEKDLERGRVADQSWMWEGLTAADEPFAADIFPSKLGGYRVRVMCNPSGKPSVAEAFGLNFG